MSGLGAITLPGLDSPVFQAFKTTFLEVVKNLNSLLLRKSSVFKDKQTLIGLILVALGTHVYYRRKHSFWSRRGVKGPKPLPILGNFHTMVLNPRQDLELYWTKKYGKVFGYYMGVKPYLVVADAAVLKQICIKDFDKFPNHFTATVKNKYQKHFIVVQNDDHWRGMRSIMSPTFTSGKIKIMFKILQNCTDDLILMHREKLECVFGDEKVVLLNTKADMGTFAVGSALSSFYGIGLDRGKSEGDKRVLTRENFARTSAQALSLGYLRYTATHLLPESILKFLNIPLIGEKPMDFFSVQVGKIIEQRKQSKRRHNDYLQLLLEAKSGNELEITENDDMEKHHAFEIDAVTEAATIASRRRLPRMPLTDIEIHCQAMMLMTVATETTSTLLANTLFLLAHHPHIQERLHDEIVKIAKVADGQDRVAKVDFEYEALTSCEYLDCVISESLRLMSPVISMDRVASEDYLIEDYGVWIPKGQVIYLAFMAIMLDPDYWPEPEKFDPERFRPGNREQIVPGSYCPFGIGPRSCIGFRFALAEAKIALAKMIYEFKYMPAPGNRYPAEFKRPSFNVSELKDVRVTFCARI